MYQRDLYETSFNILTYGNRVPKPTKFSLPSSYLAFKVFPEDIRVDVDGRQWINSGKWKPASYTSSPIEIFPYSIAIRAANVNSDHTVTSPIFPSYPDTEEIQDQPSTSKPISCGPMQKQLKAVKGKCKRKAGSSISCKSKSVRPNPQPPMANVSPADCVSLPDIILNLDEAERFYDSDSEIEVLSQTSEDSDSEALQFIPSPTYRLSATSDVTPERLTPPLSPGSTSRSSGCCNTPEISNYRVNPLSTFRWTESDTD